MAALDRRDGAPTAFLLPRASCLLHEAHAVVAGSVGGCPDIETVGRNDSEAAEDDRGRQIHETTGEAAARPPRRRLQHVSASGAARPCYAQIVAFARQLRDVEERPAIMRISAGQNLFDVTFGIAIAVDGNRLNTFRKLGSVAVGVSRRGGGDEVADTKRR